MRGPFLLLDEWFRILLSVVSGYSVSSVYIPQHLFFLCTCGNRWCVPPVVMYVGMVDDSIYEGLSPVGNLRTMALMG